MTTLGFFNSIKYTTFIKQPATDPYFPELEGPSLKIEIRKGRKNGQRLFQVIMHIYGKVECPVLNLSVIFATCFSSKISMESNASEMGPPISVY